MPDSPDSSATVTPYSDAAPVTTADYPSTMRAIMSGYHDDIGQQVDYTLADLQMRWAPVRATLDAEIARLAQQMEQALARGDTLSAGWLAEAQRLTALKSLVEGNVAQFAAAARSSIGAAQLAAIQAGTQAAQDTLAATVPAGVNYTFGVPPADVLHQLAGAVQGQTPLYGLFEEFGQQAAEQAAAALFTSVALGEGPRAAAQRLQWATDLPRQRAEVIARTEILRSWRGAQLANYRANSDVVQGWQWSADFGPRCCGACLAMDGTIHPLEEELDDHICGRCSALPLTGSWGDILRDAGVAEEDIPQSLREADAVEEAGAAERQTGEEWLRDQPAEIQNQILGPAKAEAWRQEAFQLRDLVGVRHDPQWGASIQELSLKQMGLDAQAWLAAARGAGNGSALVDAETLAEAQASARLAKTGMSSAALTTWQAQRAEAIAQAEQAAAAPEVERPSAWERQRAAMQGSRGTEGEAPAYAPIHAPRDPRTGAQEPLATYTLTADEQAFLQRLRATLSEGGVSSADEALALGQQLSARLHEDPTLARLEQLAQEAADIRARLPNNVTEEERAWFMGNREAMATHDGVSPFRAGDVYQSAYQARVRAYLGEFREVGGVELNLLTADAQYDAQVAGHLETVADLLPSDWLRASNDLGELLPYRIRTGTGGMVGWYLSLDSAQEGLGGIALGYNKQSALADLESTALHELTHRMEGAVPDLAQIEEEFYNARTAGESFVDLTNGIDQRTKLDQWLDEYLGREPLSTRSTPYYDWASDSTRRYVKSYELMTMGVEGALMPAAPERFALLQDKEYEAFVLGSLFGVQAPEAEAALAATEGEAAAAGGLGSASEAAFAPARALVGTALSDAERAAIQDAVASGDLPKSYAKYRTVEQITKTAKGRDWYAANGEQTRAPAEPTTASAETSGPTLLTADERQAVKDAVAAGDLPKSYAKYTTVEQLTKTAKGSGWYDANLAPQVEAPVTETVRDESYATGDAFPEPAAGEQMPPDNAATELPFTLEQFAQADLQPLSRSIAGVNDAYTTTINGEKYLIKDVASNAPSDAEALYRAQAEAASVQIAQALGLSDVMTPTYAFTHDGTPYIASQFLEGTKTLAQARAAFIKNVSEANLRDITLQEYLVGETDRNFGNYLYDPETYQAYTIDHSVAFTDWANIVPERTNGATRVWQTQQPGVRWADTVFSEKGWSTMTFDPAQLQQIVAQEPQVLAIMRAQGLERGIPRVEARFDVLRELSQLPHPTYQDLFDIGYAHNLELERARLQAWEE